MSSMASKLVNFELFRVLETIFKHYKVTSPNVTREVNRYENFVVIIPVLIKYLNLEKNI